MPETPIYGIPYETDNDIPGISLRPPGPIAAEVVETELQRIDSAAGTLESEFNAVEALIGDRARRIATINTGNGGNTTEFTSIPQTFRDLQIVWYGSSSGTGEIDSLALRFNGDGGNNYDSVLTRNTSTDTFSSSSGNFSVLRAGHIGTDRGAGIITIPMYTNTLRHKYATGTSINRGLSGGGNIFNSLGGGRWTGVAAITAIRIWPSGQNWDIDPHITLIGIP